MRPNPPAKLPTTESMLSVKGFNAALAKIGTGVLKFGDLYFSVKHGEVLYSVYIGDYDRDEFEWLDGHSGVPIAGVAHTTEEESALLCVVEDGDPVPGRRAGPYPNWGYLWGRAAEFLELEKYREANLPMLRALALQHTRVTILKNTPAESFAQRDARERREAAEEQRKREKGVEILVRKFRASRGLSLDPKYSPAQIPTPQGKVDPLGRRRALLFKIKGLAEHLRSLQRTEDNAKHRAQSLKSEREYAKAAAIAAEKKYETTPRPLPAPRPNVCEICKEKKPPQATVSYGYGWRHRSCSPPPEVCGVVDGKAVYRSGGYRRTSDGVWVCPPGTAIRQPLNQEFTPTLWFGNSNRPKPKHIHEDDDYVYHRNPQ
jgi:hypothetical protein